MDRGKSFPMSPLRTQMTELHIGKPMAMIDEQVHRVIGI